MNDIQKKLESWKVEREVDEYNESYAFREGYVKAMCDAINLVKNLTIPVVSKRYYWLDPDGKASNMWNEDMHKECLTEDDIKAAEKDGWKLVSINVC